MAGNVIAAALDEASAAPAFAQRMAADAGGAACLLLPHRLPLPPGSWETVWRCDVATAGRLIEAATAILPGAGPLVLDDALLQREAAGRLGARLDAPVVAAVVAARVRDGRLQVTRHAASGEGTAILTILREPAILLVDREAAASVPAGPSGTTGDERSLEIAVPAAAFRLLRETRLLPCEMELAEADVIVAGGRGVGAAGFELLAALARLLGGTVAGSRVAVDNGWLPYSRQVGLTGMTVSPSLYIACGISGAIHHTLGMRSSSHVVAINLDRDAPIFKLASVSVVADLHEVLPGLIERLRAAVEPPVLEGVTP